MSRHQGLVQPSGLRRNVASDWRELVWHSGLFNHATGQPPSDIAARVCEPVPSGTASCFCGLQQCSGPCDCTPPSFSANMRLPEATVTTSSTDKTGEPSVQCRVERIQSIFYNRMRVEAQTRTRKFVAVTVDPAMNSQFHATCLTRECCQTYLLK